MSLSGRPPATCILGLARGTDAAAAVVAQGVLVGWGRGSEQGAVAEALLRAERLGSGVEQVAVSEAPRPLARVRAARAARQLVGKRAAFVGSGLVGQRLPRRFDLRDRVSIHDPAACRAAAAYYTAGERVVLVLVEQGGSLSPWLGTSGKLVSLGPAERAEGAASVDRWRAHAGAERVRWVGDDRPAGVDAAPLSGSLACAVGAAWLAWADERQGAWVPPAWSLRGRRDRG